MIQILFFFSLDLDCPIRGESNSGPQMISKKYNIWIWIIEPDPYILDLTQWVRFLCICWKRDTLFIFLRLDLIIFMNTKFPKIKHNKFLLF